MRETKSTWVMRSSTSEEPWGTEVTWGCFPHIHGRLLRISAGKRTSLKLYPTKDEFFFVLKGDVEVQRGDAMTIEDPAEHPYCFDVLHPGAVLAVQSECPYRFKALTDVELIEVGSKLHDAPVRFADDFGRVIDAL